jgi:hypothetical protein
MQHLRISVELVKEERRGRGRRNYFNDSQIQRDFITDD